MNLSDLIGVTVGARRRLGAEMDIKLFLKTRYRDDDRFLEAETLLIFEAKTQRTWLVATEMALYCVFDIASEKGPRVKWRMGSDRIVSKGELDLPVETQDYSERTGYVIIDGKNRRKYSRLLFRGVSIKRRIRIMLRKAFNISDGGLASSSREA